MKTIKLLFTPFPYEIINRNIVIVMYIVQLVGLIALWYTLPAGVPKLDEIIKSYPYIFKELNFYSELETSFWLCIKALAISSILCLIIGYLYTVSFFSLFGFLQSKFRYMALVGLNMVFMRMGMSPDNLKLSLLVFGMSSFLMVSILGIIDDKETGNKRRIELNHARTINKNSWYILWEVIILGKRDRVIDAIAQSFAMSWSMLTMVENLARSSGGIGVLMADTSKILHFESLFAMQSIVIVLGILIDLGISKGIKKLICPYL